MMTDLKPPQGIWRGSTIMTRLGNSKTGSWLTGRNPYIFQDKYDQSLHIFRTFKTVLNAEIIDELYWIS